MKDLTKQNDTNSPLPEEHVGIFRGLFDFSFTHCVALRTIPFLYAMVLLSTVLFLADQTWGAFDLSTKRGLIYLFVISPATFFFVAAIARGILELYIIICRFSGVAEDMQSLTNKISGLTKTVGDVTDLTKKLPFRTKQDKLEKTKATQRNKKDVNWPY